MTPSSLSKPFFPQIQWVGKHVVRVLTNEYSMYAFRFVRSAIAPETIVVAVDASAIWKKYIEYTCPLSMGTSVKK